MSEDNHANVVELVGTYGDDTSHALSAWTSTSRELTPAKRNRVPELLQMLASEGHGTPFEKSTLHFLVTTDISAHIHILKHRVGVSANAESARYKELKEDKYYVPADWPTDQVLALMHHCEESQRLYHETLGKLVAAGMTRKRAKESARFFLPYATQLKMDLSFNFRSFIHFLGLRLTEHAQREVHDVASQMLALVHQTGKFDASLKAFGY